VKRNAVASPFNNSLYKFPFQLFVILEKMPVTFFTSEAVTSNHYILFVPKTWKNSLVATLKYETTTNLTYLVESTTIDTYSYNLFSKNDEYSIDVARVLRLDNYFSLFNRIRYTVIESSGKTPFSSSSVFFKNSIWL